MTINGIKTLFAGALVLGVLGSANAAMSDEARKVWEASGFMGPESAVYDAKRNIVFVSNINGDPNVKDGNGFISTMRPDGTIIKLKWVDGLSAPLGMVLAGDRLYVSDVDRLVEIEIDKGRISGKWKARDPKFLNDTAVDSAGRVYVSDMMGNTIYRLTDGKLTAWVKDTALQSPNGLMVEGDNLLVASWGVRTEGFATSMVGHMKSVDLKTGAVSSLGNGTPVGNLDGLEPDGNGAYLVTDWMSGGLYRIASSGKADLLVDLNQGSADHEFIKSKRLAIIPMMMDGTVVAYEVK
ncbi:MAG: SMP-30/gluconolactonase/LRE family protein [Rhodospirillaceae bacterium]|nr:SMP-30/gluconolactonase/LRE family protein [Rhodospirillaceae bacterium]